MEEVLVPLFKILTAFGVIYVATKLSHLEKLKWSKGLRNFMLVVVIVFML